MSVPAFDKLPHLGAAEGNCCECGIACSDHDLVADVWWCGDCIDRHLNEDERRGRVRV
jgi:hypothetical protein